MNTQTSCLLQSAYLNILCEACTHHHSLTDQQLLPSSSRHQLRERHRERRRRKDDPDPMEREPFENDRIHLDPPVILKRVYGPPSASPFSRPARDVPAIMSSSAFLSAWILLHIIIRVQIPIPRLDTPASARTSLLFLPTTLEGRYGAGGAARNDERRSVKEVRGIRAIIVLAPAS